MAKKKSVEPEEKTTVTKMKKVTVEKQESAADDSKTSKIEFKQIVVGLVILCFAVLLLLMSFPDLKKSSWLAPLFGYEKYDTYKPTNVMVMFETTTEKDVEYQVYYTVVREVWFSEDHVARLQGKKGTHYYVLNLPVEQIHKFRLDFGSAPGKVTVHDIRLMGTQSEDLSNFNEYRYHQMTDIEIDESGVSFESLLRDPFMIYRPRLLP